MEEVVSVSLAKGYVVPSVYQGNYSPIARRADSEILPTLRKHNIAFYAYSPIAGGFLSKDMESLVTSNAGRWNPSTFLGGLYHALYNKPNMLEALRLWDKISKESGISKADLAYRWVRYNSALNGELGDGVLIGSRTTEQLKETFSGLKHGPLSPEIAAQIEEVWNLAKSDAPLDNFNNSFISAE